MKTRFISAVLFLVLFSIVTSNDAYGLSCGSLDMHTSFEYSDVVFTGKAESKDYVPSQRSSAHGKSDAITNFTVIEQFKGIPQTSVDIVSSEWLWGFDFTKGLDYLVFAYDDGELRPQTCTLTSLLEHVNMDDLRNVAFGTTEYLLKQVKSEFSIVEKQVRYNIPYNISNGLVDNMVLDCESGSLLIDVYSQGEREINLDVEIPRNMLDPKTNGKDSQFFILRDGDEIGYDEIPYKDYRKLSMTLPSNTDKVEIIHAFVLALKPPMCKVADSFPYSYILPPLKQFKSGIPTNEIQCRDGLTMLLSPKDSRPVCVTGDTAHKLIPRYWGILVSRG